MTVNRITGYDEDGYLADTLNRRHPTRMNLVWIFRAVPGLMGQFERHVEADRLHEFEHHAEVECPCGDRPEVDAGRMTECPCGRFYLHLGRSVRVADPADCATCHGEREIPINPGYPDPQTETTTPCPDCG